MRSIDIDGIHIRLNGQPIYLMGAMDPQDIPDKNIYLPEYHAPTEEEIRNEVLLAKRMGFNCIRKCHQIDDHRYLRWADRLGLLVYGQPPCYRRITDASVRRWRRLVEGWVRRDRSHPSMLMWTLFNAAQGLQPMPTAYDKRAEHESVATTPEERAEMVRVAHDLVKRLDPDQAGDGHRGRRVLPERGALPDALRLLRPAVLPALARALPRPARRPGEPHPGRRPASTAGPRSQAAPRRRAGRLHLLPGPGQVPAAVGWTHAVADPALGRPGLGRAGRADGRRLRRAVPRRGGSTRCTAASPDSPNGTTGRRSRTSRTRSSRSERDRT